MRRALVAALCLGLTPATALRADIAPWWNRQWPLRRTVEAKPPDEPHAGSEVGVADFLTMGEVQPDGRDVRVVARGQEVPSKVVMVGPGDRCLVAFELVPGETTYHIYFGNREAQAPPGFAGSSSSAAAGTFRRGLLLESWEWRGGQADTLRQALESIKSAKPKQGADFVSQINHGWNPFGPSENYVHIYTGWLDCTEDGLYTFAVSAEHAAFFLVDGRPVVQRGGWGGPTWQANIRGQVRLTRGLHEVKFYHIQGRGRWNTAVLAWSLPSWNTSGQPNPVDLKFEIIPPAAFAPVARAALVDLEAQDGRFLPDFTAENVGKAWLTGNHYLVRYRFTTALKRAQLLGARLTWDFGDNTTSTQAIAEHIYLNPGTYRVSLSIHRANRTYTAANALVIDQDWTRQIDRQIDPLGRYAQLVGQQDLTRLRAADLSTFIDVLEKLKRPDEVARACRVLLLTAEDVSDPILEEKALVLARVLTEQQKHDETLEMLTTIEGRLKTPALKARLAVRAGEIRLWEKRDPAAAAGDFTRVLTRYGTARDDAVRWATIRLADVHRKQGDREKAVALYEKAAAIPPIRPQFDQTLVRPGAPKAVRVSSFARSVEAFIFEKNTEDAELLLNAWEWDYPEERVKGHSALLRARLYAAKDDHRRAVEEAEDLVAFDEQNPYVPEALFLAAQSYERLADPARAAGAYQRLVRDHPESPLVPEVRQRLKALSGAR